MRYARRCDITHEGMNEGWVTDNDQYIKYESDVLKWCEKKEYESLDEAYDDGALYYTEWDANDMEDFWVEVTLKDSGKTILLEIEEGVVFQRRIQGYDFKVDKTHIRVYKDKNIIHIQPI
jgi:hypothetical protein